MTRGPGMTHGPGMTRGPGMTHGPGMTRGAGRDGTRVRPDADPYLAGIGIGLVLLASFVFAGRGLGASGAFVGAAAAGVAWVEPVQAQAHPLFGAYLADGGPWRDWLMFEMLGVAVGAFVSAWVAGRLRCGIERGPGIGRRVRLVLACGGGIALGVGSVLARGCTSGLALSGCALLSVGSWMFMVAAFAGGYLVAPWTKRAWR